MKNIILAIIIPVVAFLAGCSTVDATRATSAGVKLLQAATISDSYVQQSVSQYIAQLDAQNRIATGNDPYAVRLARIVRPFASTGGLNFKVYLLDEANAFCTADGSVRVYSGLMDIMNDDELLGVIGHEIGHYINHDTRDAFRNALITSALRDGIGATGGVGAALSNSQLGDLGEALSGAQYSQKQESEADDYGYEFLKSHGVNPWAMAMAFERLGQLEQSSRVSSGGLQQLFSSHPNSAARAKRMAEKATRDGYKRPAATPVTRQVNSTSTDSSSGSWIF